MSRIDVRFLQADEKRSSMPENSLKTTFEQARQDGVPYLFCLKSQSTLALDSTGRPARNTAEIIAALCAENPRGNRYVAQKLLAVFDTRRDFDAQFEWQREKGLEPSLISAQFAKDYKQAVEVLEREAARKRRQVEEEESRRRRRRYRTLYGY